jgi:hypothetical protein
MIVRRKNYFLENFSLSPRCGNMGGEEEKKKDKVDWHPPLSTITIFCFLLLVRLLREQNFASKLSAYIYVYQK